MYTYLYRLGADSVVLMSSSELLSSSFLTLSTADTEILLNDET